MRVALYLWAVWKCDALSICGVRWRIIIGEGGGGQGIVKYCTWCMVLCMKNIQTICEACVELRRESSGWCRGKRVVFVMMMVENKNCILTGFAVTTTAVKHNSNTNAFQKV